MRVSFSLLALLSVLGSVPSVLTGCVGSTAQRCDGRGGPSLTNATDATWSSEAQRRAATAISCDEYEIMGRISAQGLPDTQVETLQDRVRTLAATALDAVRAAPIESSRLPLSPVHEQMYEVAAEAERESGSAPLLAWAADPWEPLDPLERPADDSAGLLSTALMRGERRALAINIRNTSATPRRVGIQIALPAFPAEALQIHQVNWTGNDESSWAAAELQLLGDASRVREMTALSGVTQQIWIQVHPQRPIDAGRFVGGIYLSAADGSAISIPVEIAIFSTHMPERPSLHFGGWDFSEGYDNYAINDANRAALIEDLQARDVDTPWAHAVVMQWNDMGAAGDANGPFDATRMEHWLSAWPNARRYRVLLYVNDYAGIPESDARFAAAVGTWARGWAAEIRRLGKAPEQFDLLLMDEPQTRSEARTTAVWAQAIRQSGAGFRIWTDPNWPDPYQTPQELIDAADTVAINLRLAERAERAYSGWVRQLSEQGKAIEIYACEGPVRRLDPYAYFRLTAWKAFFLGASGVSFWSFADTGDSRSDNEFAAADFGYSPLFINDDVVRSGKHMEAAVEGIQDTEYLRMLSDVASTHANGSTRSQATALLNAAADLVSASTALSGSQWRSTRDRAAADRLRIEIGGFLDSIVPASDP
jgi:hypothetical protein